jgi:hypothetical protein
MSNAKSVYNQNQLWDTYPSHYEKFNDYWKTAKTRWRRILKGLAVVIFGITAGLMILIFLPFNLVTGLLAALFMGIAGIGWGQVKLNHMLYKADLKTSILLWAGWKDMGGWNYGKVTKD